MRVLPLTGFSDMVAWYADMPSPDDATYERYSPFFHPVIISFTELPASNDIIRPAPNPVRGPARGTVFATPATHQRFVICDMDFHTFAGVAKTVPLAGPRTGFGAGRIISFDAGNSVKEIITGWKKGEYLSYVASSGLGISAYHATISLKPVRGKTRITWESVFADKDGKIVENFKKEIGEFYSKSLRALRKEF